MAIPANLYLTDHRTDRIARRRRHKAIPSGRRGRPTFKTAPACQEGQDEKDAARDGDR